MPRLGNDNCTRCGRSVPADDLYSVGRWHGLCSACDQAAAEKRRAASPAPPRLLQHLRELGRGPMTAQECAIVAAARVIAGRTWRMAGADNPRVWAQTNNLHAALFAAGLHMLPGSYTEAARVAGHVVIDVVPGDASALTSRLLDLLRASHYGSTAHLLISEAWLPPAAVNEFERRAGRPLGVYPQTNEA